jgi:hypothetical protein
MKLVVVTQWVSAIRLKSPLIKASPAGQERTRVPPRKGPYEAGCSAQAGRVMEPRKEERGGKPTMCRHGKAAVLGAWW